MSEVHLSFLLIRTPLVWLFIVRSVWYFVPADSNLHFSLVKQLIPCVSTNASLIFFFFCFSLIFWSLILSHGSCRIPSSILQSLLFLFHFIKTILIILEIKSSYIAWFGKKQNLWADTADTPVTWPYWFRCKEQFSSLMVLLVSGGIHYVGTSLKTCISKMKRETT